MLDGNFLNKRSMDPVKISIRIACSCVACVSACLLAVPGQAQNFNQHKVMSRAQDNANAAAARAKAAAQAHDAAERAAAALRSGAKTPEGKAKGARFTPAVVKPYLDHLSAILSASKGVTTPTQAGAFLEKFRSILPRLAQGQKQVMNGYVDFENSGEKTPANLEAEKMLTEAGNRAEAIDNELTRIEKFYGAAKPEFQKFRDLFN
jgi:hypothetical protein